MKIAFVDIQNFRRLKQCRIAFNQERTLFVGANNSGKTSAMDALGKFLKKRRFVFNDLTLSNHAIINQIGRTWEKDDCAIPNNLDKWESVLPAMDIWIDIADRDELQYVSHLIPTLKWRSGLLGVRFLLQPRDIGELFYIYKEHYKSAKETSASSKEYQVNLWPRDLCDFVDKTFSEVFALKAYLLDPKKANAEMPQKTIYEMECLDQNPLDGLIKIDMIAAQRGFSDPDTDDEVDQYSSSLSAQLRGYYDRHLDPEKNPTPEDLSTLHALETAQAAFDQNLAEKFESAINELQSLGYPGVSNPKITIATNVRAVEGLKHDSAVQYALTEDNKYKLPEKYNGLGYQNLISMVFLLMRFRDDWMQTGKIKKEKKIKNQRIEPLHLVLLEEPEAHLHMQVQQVFAKKAYGVLRHDPFLKKHPKFSTQLVISTHSSHVTREMQFSELRYFKRLPKSKECIVGTSKVVNLSDVFGKDDDTDKFVTRYLQTTHCDLFFADAVILVEGSAENMMIPHFIRNKFEELNQRYITILSINGKHSHRLKPLIEKLCITTLVIADIDSGLPDEHYKHTQPKRNNDLVSTNYAITGWLMKEASLDLLYDKSFAEKEFEKNETYKHLIRIAYQMPVDAFFNKAKCEMLPSTFEDSLIYTNLQLFKDNSGNGVITKIHNIVNSANDSEDLQEKIYQAVRTFQSDKKAEFALDLIFSYSPDEIEVPIYIKQSLEWLEKQLHQEECK